MPDPRIGRSLDAVHQATLELLEERGYHGTTVEAVARRSGVAKTTIYRHHDGKPAMVAAALTGLIEPLPTPGIEGLRDELRTLMAALAWSLTRGRWARLLPAMVEARDQDPVLDRRLDEVLAARLHPLEEAVGRAITRGELPPDTDPAEVAALLTGPLLSRRLLSAETVDLDGAHRLVDRVLAAYDSAS